MEKTTDVVYRPWITLPNGKRIFARNYGLRAFPIPVKDRPSEPGSGSGTVE